MGPLPLVRLREHLDAVRAREARLSAPAFAGKDWQARILRVLREDRLRLEAEIQRRTGQPPGDPGPTLY